jgi:hypothetical protein
MDAEDRRVKLLTEGILYDFLPAALAIMMPQQQQQQQQQQESQQAAAPPDGMGCDAWQVRLRTGRVVCILCKCRPAAMCRASHLR